MFLTLFPSPKYYNDLGHVQERDGDQGNVQGHDQVEDGISNC